MPGDIWAVVRWVGGKWWSQGSAAAATTADHTLPHTHTVEAKKNGGLGYRRVNYGYLTHTHTRSTHLVPRCRENKQVFKESTTKMRKRSWKNND